MTAGDLQDRLIAMLLRKSGGNKRRWRLTIGPVRIYDPSTHPHCNWSVNPAGDPRDIAQIEDLLDTFRLDHPLIVPD